MTILGRCGWLSQSIPFFIPTLFPMFLPTTPSMRDPQLHPLSDTTIFDPSPSFPSPKHSFPLHPTSPSPQRLRTSPVIPTTFSNPDHPHRLSTPISRHRLIQARMTFSLSRESLFLWRVHEGTFTIIVNLEKAIKT